jgi:hypothetical protein
LHVPLGALENKQFVSAGLAGETPTLGELIGSERRGVGFSDGKRTGEHAHLAAAALAHAAAGEFDALGGEAGYERAAAREIDFDGERLKTDADGT